MAPSWNETQLPQLIREIVQREIVVLEEGGVLLTVRSDSGFEIQRIACN